MSLPNGNATINIRNLAYLQSLGPGGKLDPQKLSEALDDIQSAFSSLQSRVAALENAPAPVAATPKATPAPFVVGTAGE